MRKFYYLTLLTAIAFSANATDLKVKATRNVSGLQQLTVDDAQATSRLKITDIADQQVSKKAPKKAPTAEAMVVDGTWTSVGTGAWVEGPMDYFSDLKSGTTYELEVFQNDDNPNVYRMLPYGEGSEAASLLGRANENYFYVDITNPTKVLGYGDYDDDGDFVPFGAFLISHYVPECGWNTTASNYGVYDEVEKTISFPAKSFAIQVSGGWAYTNVDGKFKIYLPGADVKDYSFISDADICNDENNIRFMAQVGKDVAAVKCLILAGTYSGNTSNYNIVAMQGSSIEANAVYTFTDDEAGVYTIFIVAVDADGNAVDGAAHWVHILNDNNDDWEALGTGTWTDPILVDATYLNTAFDADVTVERSISDPNRIRISTPYTVLSDYNLSHNGHEHYIYFDMTNPEEVKVELSLTGLELEYGHIRLWSSNVRYSTYPAAELKAAGFGIPSYDEESNTISLPSASLFYQEPYYANGSWYAASPEGKLVLPDKKGEGDITGVSVINAGSTQSVKYYNLQGMEIASPAEGQVVIRVADGKSSKMIVK